MNLIQKLTESSRPELPINPEILDREKRFNEQDPSRESWLLSHTYLCEGDLEELKRHPEFDAIRQRITKIITYYEFPQKKKGPCKRVIVSIPLSSNKEEDMNLIENKLKLDLHSRGSNAGVFYRRYQKSNVLYAEAIPARITGD